MLRLLCPCLTIVQFCYRWQSYGPLFWRQALATLLVSHTTAYATHDRPTRGGDLQSINFCPPYCRWEMAGRLLQSTVHRVFVKMRDDIQSAACWHNTKILSIAGLASRRGSDDKEYRRQHPLYSIFPVSRIVYHDAQHSCCEPRRC